MATLTRVTVGALTLLLPGLVAAAGPGAAQQGHREVAAARTGTTPAAARAPSLRVTTRVGGLNHPWDVKRLPSGSLLITERAPARLSLSKPSGGRRTVRLPSSMVWVGSETGLMGLAVDPAFKKNRRFYTYSGWKTGGGRHDVRVIAWRLNRQQTRARLSRTLLTGIPSTSGRHGGCRLLIAKNGALLVGTGDAATGTNPRNRRSLGGKTLRLNRFSGRPWRTNPFIGAGNHRRRYVFTFGHRNVQGLAQRADGTLWSVEQGSYRDDEVNLLHGRGDYGWNPVPGYDERVPMTDQRLPGRQFAARWRSGTPTVATSGATFVHGKRWGRFDGALAVAALKGQELLMIRFDKAGYHPRVSVPVALHGRYGRLRTVVSLGSGVLLVCTDGGGGTGRVLRVAPRR